MSIASFERKALFSLTRILALLIILLLFLGVAFGIYSATVGTTKIPSSKVTAENVFNKQSLPKPAKGSHAAENDPDPMNGLKHPDHPLFKQWMDSPELKRIFERQVATIEREERQEFLNEIGKVIVRAEKEQKVIGQSIQTFFQLSDEAIAAKRAAEAERKAERDKAIYGIIVGLGLMALFSLVLVLLAIERNTRTPSNQPGA